MKAWIIDDKLTYGGTRKMESAAARLIFWSQFKRGGLTCALCGKEFAEIDDIFVDHIIPKSLGGAHIKENIQPVHFHCNHKKGNALETDHGALPDGCYMVMDVNGYAKTAVLTCGYIHTRVTIRELQIDAGSAVQPGDLLYLDKKATWHRIEIDVPVGNSDKLEGKDT